MTATDDYLMHRATKSGFAATILDFGCGDGRFVEMLLESGLNVIGLDVPSAIPSIQARSAQNPAHDLLSYVRFFENPERIPLPDNSVDIVLANNVFEHILTLHSTVKELARILTPRGCVYTVFPLGSAIMEPHARLPWLHAIESRRGRLWYLRFAKALGLYRGDATPEDMERYIYHNVFYRRENEVRFLFETCFRQIGSDTETYLFIKAEAMSRGRGLRRILGKVLKTNAARLAPLVHVRHAAAFRLAGPVNASSGNNAQVFEGESIFAELDDLKSPDFGVLSSESLRFRICETGSS